MLDETLDHRHVPAARRHVRRRLACVAPCKIGVRTVVEQPVWTSRIVGPPHHVHEWRHATRDAIRAHPIAVQQFQRLEIAAASGDVRRHAVGRVGACLEQHLRQRQVPDRADRRPQRRPGKLGVPVPVVLGVRICTERAQTTGDGDEP